MQGMRYYKNIGLGFKTPSEAIEGSYVDKKCPFTGKNGHNYYHRHCNDHYIDNNMIITHHRHPQAMSLSEVVS